MQEVHNPESFTIEQTDRWGEELESLLRDYGMEVISGSELERICLAPLEILDFTPGRATSSAATHRQFLAAASLAELSPRLLAARNHPSFVNLVPHFEQLNQGDPSQAGRGRATDQATRKTFELFAAVLAMDFATSVELEHPSRGSEDNPDVVIEYKGTRWGLACKVPISDKAQSLAANVEKGAEQVVASGVDAGYPFFNVRNVVPPEEYWRADPDDPKGEAFLLFPNDEALLERAIADVANVWRGVERHLGHDGFADLLAPRPCVPAVLSYLHVLAPVDHPSGPRAMTSRFVSFYGFGRHTEADEVFVDALHVAARSGWASGQAR